MWCTDVRTSPWLTNQTEVCPSEKNEQENKNVAKNVRHIPIFLLLFDLFDTKRRGDEGRRETGNKNKNKNKRETIGGNNGS